MLDNAHAPARGRPLAQDVLTGLALTAGAVAVSAVLAKAFSPPEDYPEAYSDYEDPNPPEPAAATPRRTLFGVLWPPLFLALTLSGLRIWSAPRGPARTQALTLWAMAQALNTVWMAFGPRRLGGQVASTVASIGAAGAYAIRARRLDPAANRATMH